MKQKVILTTLVFSLLFQNVSLALAANESPQFLLRTPNSNLAEFNAALKKSSSISYIDWILFDAKSNRSAPKDLDEALELSLTQPLAAYEKLNQILAQMHLSLLNQQSRELTASILIKMSELKVPQRWQESALHRAQELVSAHASLREIPAYKETLFSGKSGGHSLDPAENRIDSRQFEVVMTKIAKMPGLEEAVLLLNGDPLNEQVNFKPPKGEQQWALASNTYSLILFNGTWQEFASKIFAVDALQALAEGQCDQVRLISNDYQIQTQGRVFSLAKCFDFESKPSNRESAAGAHLAEPFPNAEAAGRKNNIWIATGLVLAAGLAYTLKDKSISVKMPGFH